MPAALIWLLLGLVLLLLELLGAEFEGNDQGRVQWQDQSWAATNLEGDRTLPSSSEVVVMGRGAPRQGFLHTLGCRLGWVRNTAPSSCRNITRGGR